MQSAGTHGLDLGRIGLCPVPLHLFACLLCDIVHKLAKDILVNRRVLHSGVREDEGVRIEPLTRILWRVREEIPVLVAVLDIQIAAILALIGNCRVDHAKKQSQGNKADDSSQYCS